MVVHTFHLANPGVVTTMAALVRPPTSATVAGLHHAECMMPMQLGAPMLSPARWQMRRLAMFAAWEDEAAIDAFMQRTRLGRALAAGWHFHTEFTTLRFTCIGEYGAWEGRTSIVPTSPQPQLIAPGP